MNLYNLTAEYLSLYDELIAGADGETGEVDVDVYGRFQAIEEDFQRKTVSVGLVVRRMDDEIELVEREIERLTTYKQRIERGRDRVKEALLRALESTQTKQVKSVYATVSIRESEQTVIDDETKIPPEYMRERTERSPMKGMIKAAIAAGEEIPGAHVERVRRVHIR